MKLYDKEDMRSLKENKKDLKERLINQIE